ncbi:hypothetical protein PVAP13_2KG126844 [Panicum virgatum]|uniref:Uncharacterized protein n=1 Tax=Panicum virgatum TaxID=38727 RepID=A0A8T0W8D9_PANVG|nr:hypothetical protein PVAP13_2KG126844 [Panicum virgatum]
MSSSPLLSLPLLPCLPPCSAAGLHLCSGRPPPALSLPPAAAHHRRCRPWHQSPPTPTPRYQATAPSRSAGEQPACRSDHRRPGRRESEREEEEMGRLNPAAWTRRHSSPGRNRLDPAAAD